MCRPTRFIMKVENVFKENTLKKVNQDINALPTIQNDTKENVLRVLFKGGESPKGFAYENVSFDQHAYVTEWDEFKANQLGSAPDSVVDMAQEAAEKMAKSLGWENTTVEMTANILAYRLNPTYPKVTSMPWHQDDTGENNISMTTVFTRCNQDSVGFRGGELGFRVADYQGRYEASNFALYRNYRPLTPEQKKGHKFSYPYNGGFIFNNKYSEHRVHDVTVHNPIELTEYKVERRLFTLFTRVDAKQLTAAAEKVQAKNLLSAEDAETVPEETRKAIIKHNNKCIHGILPMSGALT